MSSSRVMKKCFWTSSVIFLFVNCTKVTEDGDVMSNEDFVLQASVVNSAEMDIGSLANTRGINEGVKAFAQSVAAYHEAAQSQLRNLAIGLNLLTADSLDAQHIILRNQLLNLAGRAFDSLYIHTQVQDYEQATKLFFQEVISGQSSQLRNYSASILPQLEAYLHQADSLAAEY